MKPPPSAASVALCLLLATFVRASAQETAANPAHWAWAPTPPMGWNSYDAWGTSITEDEFLSNARYMRDHLLSHGWKYVVVDARWYDADSPIDDRDFNKKRVGALLSADEVGRLIPSVSRFPSAANGMGFGPLAGQVHAMGLKFGIHVMRHPEAGCQCPYPLSGRCLHRRRRGRYRQSLPVVPRHVRRAPECRRPGMV